MSSTPSELSAAASPPQPTAGTPWGPWPTLGFSRVIAGIHVVVSVVVVVACLLTLSPAAPPDDQAAPSPMSFDEHVRWISGDGNCVSLLVLSTGLVVPACCLIFAWLRPGITTRDYLGLRKLTGRQAAGWVLAGLALPTIADGISKVLGRTVIPEFSIDTYTSVAFEPLLWLAFIAGAPLAEEFFFRGFLFVGLQQSRLGNTGTTVVTSAAWAGLHGQYDLFQIGTIFVFGLLLGYARIRSGTLTAPLLMHAANNLLATVQVALYVRFWG